jgi:hypothetical protein
VRYDLLERILQLDLNIFFETIDLNICKLLQIFVTIWCFYDSNTVIFFKKISCIHAIKV